MTVNREVTKALLLHGEAFVTDGGEVLDPARVELRQSGGQIAEVIVKNEDRRLAVIDDPQVCVEAILGDEVPDRICIERRSPHYDPVVDNLGVKIDGIEQDSVIEYSVSERWARIGERDHRGKLIWEFDKYRTRRVEDVTVEPYWRRALSRQQRRARAAKMRKRP